MKLNSSIKHHIVIGALLTGWIFLFTFLIRPFAHGQMDLEKWVFVSCGFSLFAFVSYAIISFLQNIVFAKLKRWNLVYETGVYLLFFSLYTILTYIYYIGPFVKGFYTFSEFFFKIILNAMLVLTPVLLFARRYANKLIPVLDEFIIIKGDNKMDFLKIKKDELICISNAQNYVEIYFMEEERLKTKLIRSTMKKIQHEFDFLIQVHRSHIINPSHFKSWKDSTTILLTQVEIPVSKNYKNRLLSL